MTTPAETAAGIAVELFIAAVAAGILYRIWGRVFAVPKRQAVLAFQRGVLFRGEVLEKVVGPGTYWITPKRTLLLCDIRPQPFQVTSQELATSDEKSIRVSLQGEYRIVDPSLFLMESSHAFDALYLEVRQALRIAVGELKVESILAGRDLVAGRVKELVVPRAAQLGLELMQIDVWEAIPVFRT